ncbi:helix-turn-helix transcriptional regulator [Candidatus Amarolinea dominans]|uniref:helix-turn-helix domain-containing protein n=1 Tax=Candidatus Amarolinea dominans TaxID=3140696 RepID=UPI003134F209|nr:helix-turn-helix transcriptional regulator [Anaerolineae bacterium]
MNFADWLQQELRARGWNQAELVRRSGLSVAYVSNLVSGMRSPGTGAISQLARALGVSPEEIMRQAGMFPASANSQQTLAELSKKIEKLSESDRQIILAMVNRMGGMNN